MQDQGKRLLIAVVLALGVMLVWNAVFSPKTDDQKKKDQQATPTAPMQVNPSWPTTIVGSAPAAATHTKATTIALTFPKFVATFSSKGGVLESWRLSDKRYENDETKGEMLASDRGAFAVGFTKESTYQLPADQDWTGKQISDHQVEYTYSTPELDLVKDFDVVPESFTVRVKIGVKAKAPNAHETLVVSSYQLQDPKKTGGGSSRIQPRVWDSSTMRAGEIVSTPITSLIEKGPRFEKNVQWTGFEHPFLLVGFAPEHDVVHQIDKYTFAEGSAGLMRTDMEFLPAGTSSGEIVAYLGPKNYNQLKETDTVAGFTTGFKETIDFGWFGIIGRPLMWVLLEFHDVAGNWGIAILMLTICVKLATLYWTTKSMRSMKAMAVLGPQMKGLQEKYKEDKQRLQMETMALYKQNGVNPLAGCLPILLQTPIWIALYRMVQSAGELYQQPFIHGWIDDLTNNDPTYVLPVALIILMFVQARLQPSNPDPSQKMQQRLMQYGMPIMFGVFCLWAPACVTLYIFANTCLSALHSIYINKYDQKSIELAAKLRANQVAAKAAKDEAAAKVAKDANAKDEPAKPAPKGPSKSGANKGKKGRR
ncbi:MAG TPA: membrane protein insertase YidC [Kofleriaceae bacterium]|jgi:YidC/Oxa1 family membrane protein insertase